MRIVLCMMVMATGASSLLHAGSSRDLRRAAELLGDVPGATNPERLKELGLDGQRALMGFDASGDVAADPEPVQAGGSGLRGYIRSEWGSNWDPSWKKQAEERPSSTVPRPEGHDGRPPRKGPSVGAVSMMTGLAAALAVLAAMIVVPSAIPALTLGGMAVGALAALKVTLGKGNTRPWFGSKVLDALVMVPATALLGFVSPPAAAFLAGASLLGPKVAGWIRRIG